LDTQETALVPSTTQGDSGTHHRRRAPPQRDVAHPVVAASSRPSACRWERKHPLALSDLSSDFARGYELRRQCGVRPLSRCALHKRNNAPTSKERRVSVRCPPHPRSASHPLPRTRRDAGLGLVRPFDTGQSKRRRQRERDRERERETERERDRERERQRQRGRERERQRQRTERERQRETERGRDREGERERERERQRGRERETETEREGGGEIAPVGLATAPTAAAAAARLSSAAEANAWRLVSRLLSAAAFLALAAPPSSPRWPSNSDGNAAPRPCSTSQLQNSSTPEA
jgi:hypothetical protein